MVNEEGPLNPPTNSITDKDETNNNKVDNPNTPLLNNNANNLNNINAIITQSNAKANNIEDQALKTNKTKKFIKDASNEISINQLLSQSNIVKQTIKQYIDNYYKEEIPTLIEKIKLYCSQNANKPKNLAKFKRNNVNLLK